MFKVQLRYLPYYNMCVGSDICDNDNINGLKCLCLKV